LHADIHRYNVAGETHYANATNPALPAAFAGMVSSNRDSTISAEGPRTYAR